MDPETERFMHQPGNMALALLIPAIKGVRVQSAANWIEQAAVTIQDDVPTGAITLSVTVTLTDQEPK